MSGDHNRHQADQCNHIWWYIGSKRQAAWQCPHCESLRFLEQPKTVDELRGDDEELPPVKTYCGGKPNYCETEETKKREWVGLADEELISAYESEQAGRWGDHIRSLRAIEAKLKEKNN